MTATVNLAGEDPRLTIDPATDAEEQAIRDAVDTFLLGEGSASVKGKLHLAASEDTPRCNDVVTLGDDRDWRAVDPAVYPPGHKDLCRYCVAAWRQEGGDD